MPIAIEAVCKELDNKYKKILSSKKHSNSLIELIKCIEESSKIQIRLHSITLLTKLFTNYYQNGDLPFVSTNNLDDNNEILAEIKFKKWLQKQFDSFSTTLIDNLSSTNINDREKSEYLNSLFECIQQQTKSSVKLNNENQCQFPFDLFHRVLNKLLSDVVNLKLIKKYCKYLHYDDIRYFTLKYILDALNDNEIALNEIFLENVLQLISMMPGLTKESTSNGGIKNDEQSSDNNSISTNSKTNTNKLYALLDECITENSKITNVESNRKIFNDCVFKILSLKLSNKLFKKVLVKLPEKLFPKMSNPLLCTDFLNESYKLGGLISILALNGLYTLIARFNIEIPEFYKKLYEQVNVTIFQTKYKNRFFVLLDNCLQSTHLSVILVACFIKKIARLLLFAPAPDVKYLIKFIVNLLIRHPTCKILISKQNAKTVLDDPFDVDSLNLNQQNVLYSSLWELKAISNHYLADVAREIKGLANFPTHEVDLYELLDTNDYESLMKQELERKYPDEVPFNYTCEKNPFSTMFDKLDS